MGPPSRPPGPPPSAGAPRRGVTSLRVAVLLLAALAAARPAGALSILSVSGQDGDTSGTVLTLQGEALAAAFELSAGFSDVEVVIPFTCLECQAEFYLVKNELGPDSAFVTNLQAVSVVDTLDGGGFIGAPTTLFSGLSLDAGVYYLVLALTSDSVSGGVWSATQLAVVSAAPGAANLPDLDAPPADFDVSTPPRSVFGPHQVSGVDTLLQLSLSGEPVAAPGPPPLPLLLAALAAWGLRRRSATG